MTTSEFRKFVYKEIDGLKKRIEKLEKENNELKEIIENEDIVLEAKNNDIIASK